MATFVLSTLTSSIASKQAQLLNTFRQSPFGMLFQKDKRRPDKLSPRLKDLTLQKSAYNEIIPVVYGKNRLAGNIIWATDIQEVESVNTTYTGGGKGAPKVYQTTRTYNYYANLAIAISQGEVSELNRVWADTELLDLSKYIYRFYKGTETQSPDSLIQATEGVGMTPAYRGLCYIVFESFPLAKFGNRIPNFTFEITRNLDINGYGTEKLEDMIAGVNVIPGCGEFVYDITVQYKKEGAVINGSWVEYGKRTRINQNNNSNKADSLVSLDQLEATLPNCGWIAPVVTWFGDNLDIASCAIKPRVEYGNDSEGYPVYTEPNEWAVGSWTRFNTPIVGNDNGVLRYGGTISDSSLVRYLQEAKTRGFNIMFYPMFFMDIADKPWRGHLTGSVNDVNNFFTKTNGYNDFILHYANLVKNYVDAFIIGSELVGLTSLQAGDDSFPAVDKLVALASSVKTIVGSGVKVSYAGDWSEYHHTTGGWYNLDKLWASSNIDFIGIDAYFPLTDKVQSSITKQDIIDGWTSGEGYDWYYTDEERTSKADLDEEYAWKNIAWWWENYHYNPGDVQTDWVPESKKIWFTEYGFASVDGTSNEPNRFYDPNCYDGGFPRFSEGRVDGFAQRQALQATEEKWKNSSMIERKFVWCWDARPYPFYPNNFALWSDGYLYKYGHWLNGKLGGTIVSQLIAGILMQSGVASELIGDIAVYENVDGVAINNKIKVINLLDILRKVYFFDCVESDGVVKFCAKNDTSVVTIEEDELILLKREDDREIYLETSVIGDDELPRKLSISFINKDLNYQIGNSYAERGSVTNGQSEIENAPIVLSEYKARQVAEVNLYSLWMERVIYSFVLPIKYLYLEPTDVITLVHDGANLKLRIVSVNLKEDNGIHITAVRCDNAVYSTAVKEDNVEGSAEIALPIGETNMSIFELPALNSANLDRPIVLFTANGQENGWNGCLLYVSKNGGGSFDAIDEAKAHSFIGMCCNTLGDAKPYYFDYKNSLTVYFDDRMDVDIDNASEADIFSGANMAMVGNEIVQFKTIALQEDGSYKLSGFLRGLFGTEKEIDEHVADEAFVLLNKGLMTHTIEDYNIGLSAQYRAVSTGQDLSDVTSVNYAPTGRSLKPLSPVHLKGARDESGNLTLSWKRRSRGYSGWRDGVDLPLVEKVEKYEIEIMNGATVARTIEVFEASSYVYTASAQVEDFGSVQNSVDVRIYQMSEVVGRGEMGERVV